MDEKLILIADDDRDLVTALSIRLRSAGYEVVGAYDGEETFRVAQERKPDLIILDIRMPAGGGFSSIDKLKHSLGTMKTPVIFLTAFDDDEVRDQALSLGCVGYFRKPFNETEFMEAIRKALGET
jgi:DNA-binding response OmpR family regulator